MRRGIRRAVSRAATIGIIVIVIIIIAAASVYFAFYQSPKSSSTNVTFGIPVKASYQFTPIYYAQSNNYFSNNGVNVTINAYTGDAALSTAISSNSISIGMDNIFSIEHFISAGLPIQIIAQVTSANDFVVISNASSHYTTPSSLNNTKIGVTSVPGLTDQLAINFGLNNSIAVTPTALGGLTGQLAGLEQNQSQAFIWTFDEAYNLVAQGQGRIVANLSSYYPQWKTEMVLFATNSMIQNQGPTVQKVVNSVFQALNGIKANPSGAASYFATFLNLNSQAATNTIARAVTLFSYDGAIDSTGVSYAITFDVSSGLIPSGTTPPVASSTYTNQFTPATTTT